MIETHTIKIIERDDPRKELFPDQKQYRAVCTCGWITPWYHYYATAESEAQDHV
jgi:hypothetical protein